MRMIETDAAAKPLGHYSQAVVHNGVVYVATQLGIVPGKPIHVGTIEEQTKAVLNNVQNILKAAGSDLTKVIRVTIYISDINLWDEVNAIYMQFFKEHKPAVEIAISVALQFFHMRKQSWILDASIEKSDFMTFILHLFSEMDPQKVGSPQDQNF